MRSLPSSADERSRSPIHRLPATGKLLVALLLVTATVVAPWPMRFWAPVLGLLLAALAAASRIPVAWLAKRLLLVEPFVLGVALLALFQPNGGAVFADRIVRSTLCVFTMILLAGTTPFAGILAAFRRLHMPALLVTILALMYRYLFVLADEGARMRRARASRSFGGGRRLAWRTPAGVAARLFVRSSERAERIYAAMCSRGWRE